MTKKKKARKGPLNPILKDLLIRQVAWEHGIVPLTRSEIDLDFNRILSTLSEEESRTARRKFRKLWRKAQAEAFRANQWLVPENRGLRPTRGEKRRRKVMVMTTLEAEATRRASQNNSEK